MEERDTTARRRRHVPHRAAPTAGDVALDHRVPPRVECAAALGPPKRQRSDVVSCNTSRSG